MEDRSFVHLPTENSGFGQTRASFPGQDGVEKRGGRGKEREEEEWEGGAQGRVLREEVELRGGQKVSQPLRWGIPTWPSPDGALPGAASSGYFGWQRDWERGKQKIEW